MTNFCLKRLYIVNCRPKFKIVCLVILPIPVIPIPQWGGHQKSLLPPAACLQPSCFFIFFSASEFLCQRSSTCYTEFKTGCKGKGYARRVFELRLPALGYPNHGKPKNDKNCISSSYYSSKIVFLYSMSEGFFDGLPKTPCCILYRRPPFVCHLSDGYPQGESEFSVNNEFVWIILVIFTIPPGLIPWWQARISWGIQGVQ
jgi:hypothetical protein